MEPTCLLEKSHDLMWRDPRYHEAGSELPLGYDELVLVLSYYGCEKESLEQRRMFLQESAYEMGRKFVGKLEYLLKPHEVGDIDESPNSKNVVPFERQGFIEMVDSLIAKGVL